MLRLSAVVLCAALVALWASPAASTDAAGQAYLEGNGKQAGWTTTASGLQYFVEEEGNTSVEPPSRADKVECHYRGSLIDGTEFDSSYKRNRPATFGVTQVIKGWTEALLLMRPGAKWKLAIPSELAYGDRDRGQFIKAGNVLLFDIEILSIPTRKSEL